MRKMSWAAMSLICAVAFLLLATPAAPQSPNYKLLKKVTLGGAGGWDYLTADPVTHRVFISHSTHVIVVDAEGKVVGDISDLQGTHGAVIVQEFGHGFTSNGGSNSATMFDLKTLKVLKEIKLPDADRPDGFMYDPFSKRVFFFNARSHNTSAVDAKTGEAVGTIDLGGKPEAARTDGAGHVWVNIEDKAQLVEFDSKQLKVLNTWPLPDCEEPTGMSIDLAHQRLFIGCHSKQMLVSDYQGHIVSRVPIGEGVDATEFDPATDLAFASCGDGTIIVAHQDSPDKYTVVQTISTQRGARTMTLDTANHNLYTVTAEFGPTPVATPENPRARPPLIPGTFTLLIYGR